MPPSFYSEEQNQKLSPGDPIRLKIVGTKYESTEIVRDFHPLIIVVRHRHHQGRLSGRAGIN